MDAWDDESKVVISSLLWKKPLFPQQQGSTKCTYYMMLNLFQYFKARHKGLDTIFDGGKWFTAKDAKELWGAVYKIIEDAMLVKWRKEFPNRDETMYERPR